LVVNVFYVRNDLLNNLLPKPPLKSVYENEWAKKKLKEWDEIKKHPWLEV
tara:strand:- start:396 stop:545 length:150 start_codon:yes stop_codon:yes gene_type:complete